MQKFDAVAIESICIYFNIYVYINYLDLILILLYFVLFNKYYFHIYTKILHYKDRNVEYYYNIKKIFHCKNINIFYKYI